MLVIGASVAPVIAFLPRSSHLFLSEATIVTSDGGRLAPVQAYLTSRPFRLAVERRLAAQVGGSSAAGRGPADSVVSRLRVRSDDSALTLSLTAWERETAERALAAAVSVFLDSRLADGFEIGGPGWEDAVSADATLAVTDNFEREIANRLDDLLAEKGNRLALVRDVTATEIETLEVDIAGVRAELAAAATSLLGAPESVERREAVERAERHFAALGETRKVKSRYLEGIDGQLEALARERGHLENRLDESAGAALTAAHEPAPDPRNVVLGPGTTALAVPFIARGGAIALAAVVGALLSFALFVSVFGPHRSPAAAPRQRTRPRSAKPLSRFVQRRAPVEAAA